MKKLIFLMFVLAIGTAPAVADLVPVAEPGDSGSWYQAFTLTDLWGQGYEQPPHFDMVGIKMTQGQLESSGITVLTVLNPPITISYGQTKGGVYYDIVGTGTNNDDLDFRLTFAGSISSPVQFDVVVWDYEKISKSPPTYAYLASGWETATWDGMSRSWNIVDNSADLTTYGGAHDLNVVVPVPAAVLLGVLGLCAAGMKLRKLV